MGRKLASGGFGTVYLASLPEEEEVAGAGPREVIVKKATEFGEAEVRGAAARRLAARARLLQPACACVPSPPPRLRARLRCARRSPAAAPADHPAHWHPIRP